MDVKLTLTTTEHKDLIAYCNLNDLLVSSVVKDSFITGFNIERYGLLNSGERVVEKEVIKEVIKRVEVPVEVEKEVVKIEYVEVEKLVEVINEVEVEKIVEKIIEVHVEKIVNINDETQIKELLDKIKELENNPPQIVEKVKEVEIIKEIPVEVIKEVIVEKEVGGNLQPKLDALQNTVQKLKQDNIEKDKKIKEYEKTIQDIQKFNEDRRAMFLSGSNLEKPLIK